MTIEHPAVKRNVSTPEWKSVIKFLVAVKCKLCEICRRMCDVYRKACFILRNVLKWAKHGFATVSKNSAWSRNILIIRCYQ